MARAATPTPYRWRAKRWRSSRRRSAPTTPTSAKPQQPGGAVPRPGPLRRGRAALQAQRWRSARRRSAPTTPTSPTASTTWRCCTAPGPLRRGRAALQAQRWRSARRRSAPTTPTSPPASTTWRRCTEARAATPRPSRSTSARWRSARRRSGPTTPTSPRPQQPGACCTDDQGRYAEAEPLYKRALAIREKALGPDHPDVADSLNNLAGLYRDPGPVRRGRAALPARAGDPREGARARPPRRRPRSLNNLAVLYRRPGPLRRGRAALQARAGDPREGARPRPPRRRHQPQQPGRCCTATQGRYAEAEPLYKRALAIREKALGPDHPDVATSLNNLAVLYRDPGPLRRGRAALQARPGDPREGARTRPPRRRPPASTTWRCCTESQGRYAEAEPLYKRALAIREKALGPTTPTSPTASTTWPALYRAQGRYAEAEPLYKRSLAIREKALGPDHPDVASSLNNLAALYHSQGRDAEGLNFSRRAVAILGKRFGKETFAQASDNSERRSRGIYFLNNINLVHAVGEPAAAAESFHVSQFASTSTAAQAVAGMAARFAAGTDALAAVVRERQDLAQRWQRLDAAIVKAVSEPPGRRVATAEAALRQELAAATIKLDALMRALSGSFRASLNSSAQNH